MPNERGYNVILEAIAEKGRALKMSVQAIDNFQSVAKQLQEAGVDFEDAKSVNDFVAMLRKNVSEDMQRPNYRQQKSREANAAENILTLLVTGKNPSTGGVNSVFDMPDYNSTRGYR